MSGLKLKLAMMLALTILIGLTTLFSILILDFLGFANIYMAFAIALIFNVFQWLISPYMINLLYGVKKASPLEYPKLHYILDKLSQKANIPKPKLMIANIPIPNAFAYGSPITGKMVAVTAGLLNTLDEKEIEAVIGHELGHIKHKDLEIMMIISLLPAVFYFIARLTLFSYSSDRRERGYSALIGIISFIAYWILSLIVLYLSRLREYYADTFSIDLADDPQEGASNLAEALAKIALKTGLWKIRGYDTKTVGAFKALFISDPDNAERDIQALGKEMGYGDQRLVRQVLSRDISLWDQLVEIFSTHPNIVKRIKLMYEYARAKSR